MVVACAALFFSLGGAGFAQAQPVRVQRATAEIRADKLDFPTSPRVDWCARKRYGTICGVSLSACFVDHAFGYSVMTTHNLLWVSRAHGVVSVALLPTPWPPPPADIFPLYTGTCVPGEIATPPS